METYEPQVKSWLNKAGREQLDEPIEDLVSAVFAKIAKAIPPMRFADFPTLEDILDYFGKCSRTYVWQRLRKAKHQPLLELHEDYPDKQSLEAQVDHQFLAQHIERLLTNDTDYLLFRLHYHYDRKTAQHVSWHLFRLKQKLQDDATLRSWSKNDPDAH
jgi:hypothetical protein